LEELPKLINERTKLLSITQVSNALVQSHLLLKSLKLRMPKVFVFWLMVLNLFRTSLPMYKP
jgi:hypothetical protein